MASDLETYQAAYRTAYDESMTDIRAAENAGAPYTQKQCWDYCRICLDAKQSHGPLTPENGTWSGRHNAFLAYTRTLNSIRLTGRQNTIIDGYVVDLGNTAIICE